MLLLWVAAWIRSQLLYGRGMPRPIGLSRFILLEIDTSALGRGMPRPYIFLRPYFLLLELFSKSFLRKQPNQLVTGWAVSLYKNVFVSVVGYLSTTLPLFTF